MRKLGPSSFEGLLLPPIISHCNSIENTCKVLRADKVFRTTLFILHLGSENMSTISSLTSNSGSAKMLEQVHLLFCYRFFFYQNTRVFVRQDEYKN